MKLVVYSQYDCEPLEVKKVNRTKSEDVRQRNNIKIGKQIFKWMRSQAPSGIYYGFLQEYHHYMEREYGGK